MLIVLASEPLLPAATATTIPSAEIIFTKTSVVEVPSVTSLVAPKDRLTASIE